MNPKFLTLTIPLLLAACTFAPVTDENMPDSKVPVGSTLILKRSIVVPANAFFAFLKEGDDPGPNIDRDERDTRCTLEMRQRHSSDRTIEPTEFQVTRTEDKVDYTANTAIQVAQVATFRNGNPALEVHITEIHIASDIYPDVGNIQCQRSVEYGFGFPLSVTTLRWAFGGHFDLVANKNTP